MTTTSQDWKGRALGFSLFLNFLLLALIFYLFLQNPVPVPLDFSHPSTSVTMVPPSNKKEICQLVRLSKEELYTKLKDKTLCEDGYHQRDLALAILAKRDHIDVERALSKPLSRRIMRLNERIELTCFPDLGDKDFEVLTYFVEKEEWPQTKEGLFLLLKKEENPPPSLIQAFSRTEDFLLVKKLFQSTKTSLKDSLLLQLLLEAPYSSLNTYVESQRRVLTLDDTQRRAFLVSYVHANSKTAAALLLKLDYRFALKEMEDRDLVQLLSLLPLKTKLSLSFAKELLDSPRGDEVGRAALALLEQSREEITLEQPVPKTNNQKKPTDSKASLSVHPEKTATNTPSQKTILKEKPIAQRPGPRPSIGNLRPTFRDRPPAAPDPSVHVVVPGETLRTIAEKNHLPVEYLMQINHLQQPSIAPGKTLKIPPVRARGLPRPDGRDGT